jgi:hypothetical protein
MSRLQSLKHEANRTIVLEKRVTDHAVGINEQHAQAIQAQGALQDERERQRGRSKEWEALQQHVTLKKREAATYTRLIKTKQSSLHSLRSEHDALAAKIHLLAADRELFAFWSSALAKRTHRTSSSSSTRSSATATTTFREHVLVQSLSELTRSSRRS